jgi:hypothetical protein
MSGAGAFSVLRLRSLTLAEPALSEVEGLRMTRGRLLFVGDAAVVGLR